MTLYEELEKEFLIEGIKEVQAKYPNIAEEKFFELIKLDPTYKDDVDSVGTYGKWILNLYNKNKLKDEDFYKVTDYLTEFEEKKKWMPSKDIGFYKTLPDLKKAIDDTEISMSQNQKNKAFKKRYKQADLDADLVYEDEKWEVWIPKTYESSCKLATDTEWCTGPSSHGNDYYYRTYVGEGPLYINLNKQDEDEKYQFHFPSKQFMDKYDERINLNDFLNEEGNAGLKDYYISLLKPQIEETVKKLKEVVKEKGDHNKEIDAAFDKVVDTLGDFLFIDEFKEEVDYLLSIKLFDVDRDDFKGNRDMSGAFIQDCFYGDVSNYFRDGYSDSFSIDDALGYHRHDIDEKTDSTLIELGFPANIYDLIYDDNVPKEFEDDVEALQLCFELAYIDGQEIGASNEALKDFESALKNSAPNHTEYVGHDDYQAYYKISRDFVEENWDEIDYQLNYWSDSYIDCLQKVLTDLVNEDFEFTEPYSGWYNFDEEAFNESLQEELLDSFSDRK